MPDLLIGCEIEICSQHCWISAVELCISKKGNYKVKITSDPYEMIESSALHPKKFMGLSRADSITLFKKLCVDIYTLDGEFSFEDLIKGGDKIRFYNNTGFLPQK